MKLHVLLASCLALLATALPAQAQTAEERRQLDWVLERGRALFAIDRAAWVGTDDLREQIRDLNAAGVRGYIVDRDGNGPNAGYVIIFYGEANGGLETIYRGRVGPRGIVSREVFNAGQRPPLTPVQQRLARAQQQLRRLQLRNCGPGPMNSALIPPTTPDGPIAAYVMTAQTDNASLPFGGHYRMTIAVDGTISGERPFTNSCISLPLPQRGQRRPVAMFITHALDPLPTEIHVFSAMAAGIPVAVGTGQRVWMVTPDSIRLSNMPAPPPPGQAR